MNLNATYFFTARKEKTSPNINRYIIATGGKGETRVRRKEEKRKSGVEGPSFVALFTV